MRKSAVIIPTTMSQDSNEVFGPHQQHAVYPEQQYQHPVSKREEYILRSINHTYDDYDQQQFQHHHHQQPQPQQQIEAINATNSEDHASMLLMMKQQMDHEEALALESVTNQQPLF